MSRQTLKDAHYHVIGYIETDSNGKQTLKDAHYHVLGFYDPKSNETKDAHYHKVGTGNLLTTLL
jgi:diadenosine tetraphosphate (Ap4A) HIT family hydrolase